MKFFHRALLFGAPVACLIGGLFATVSIAAAAGKQGACGDFVPRLPNLSSALCEAARLQDSGARSAQGRPLWVKDLVPSADNAAKPPKPPHRPIRVLVIGAIHGDEPSSSSLAFHWLALADQGSASRIHWRFVPALNPDGLLAQPPRRVNANGVDLNRNFPTPGWQRDAKIYWENRTKKDPRRYPGKTPLSEPESRFLHDEMQRFAPNVIVSIHAPYGVLDFDGPPQKSPKGIAPPPKLGRLYLDQVGIFPGSLGNYGGVHKGVPVVTIELPNSTRTPLDAEMQVMWKDLLSWINDKIADPASAGAMQPVAQTGPSRP